jgi:hypothetical protein
MAALVLGASDWEQYELHILVRQADGHYLEAQSSLEEAKPELLQSSSGSLLAADCKMRKPTDSSIR